MAENIALMINNPALTTAQIAASMELDRRNIESYIRTLKKAGLVEREGARKNGRWLVKLEN